ncbi:MAG: hypothetical protein LBI95_04235 [Holosporales bacterium]|nr:hypothetical protein [Holosporales bacterium]
MVYGLFRLGYAGVMAKSNFASFFSHLFERIHKNTLLWSLSFFYCILERSCFSAWLFGGSENYIKTHF